MGATPGEWTDEQYAAFADGALVVALGTEAQPVALPAALAADDAVEHSPQVWVDMLSLVHHIQRGTVVRSWWRSHEQPGEIVECEVLAEVGGPGRLHRQRIKFANLLHDPGAECVLLAVVDLGVAEAADEEEPKPVETYHAPSWAISSIDNVGNMLSCDGMVKELYGRSAEELVGRNVMETVHPEAQDVALDMWIEVVSEIGSTRTFQHRSLHPDGTLLWIESTVMNRREPDGTGSILIISHDIEERRRELTALRESQEQFRMLAEEVPAGVFRANRWGRVEYANARWYQLLSEEAIPATVERLHDIVHLDDRAAFTAAWSQLFSVEPSAAGELEPSVLELRTSSGARVLSLSCRVAGVGTDGRTTVIGAMYDVTATTELQYRADHDPLTGLLNRQSFDRRLAELLVERATGELAGVGEKGDPASDPGPAVFFVDLDGFKPVNDRFGHDIGDVVLQTVAQRLRTALRPGDIVARYGGDEFVVLCLAVPGGGEDIVRARIERVLAAPIAWDGGSWLPSASIGVARPRRDDGPDTVLRRADEAMYDVKRTRRGS